MTIFANDYTNRDLVGTGALIFKIVNSLLTIVPMIILTIILYLLFKNTFEKYAISNIFLASSFVIIWAIVIWMLSREFSKDATEVPASWFAILNSFFIIVFAPVLSKIWQTKYNPSGPVKFGIGLMLLSFGFAILSFGSINIPLGAATASQSMIFLILAYLFHTLGELCVSPVGLSYVSKLAPQRLVGLMFGVWFVANFIANYSAGITGSYIDPIVEDYGMAVFFLIFTILPAFVGLLMILANKKIVAMMHGIE
jgi:POT family proton-dependent oligopeptide transporter